MNSAEKPHWDADSSVSLVLRRSPVFRISKPFLSKFITRSRARESFHKRVLEEEGERGWVQYGSATLPEEPGDRQADNSYRRIQKYLSHTVLRTRIRARRRARSGSPTPPAFMGA